MDKMEERTRQRILDLANLADRRGIITYTDFMNLNELNIFTARSERFHLFDGNFSAVMQKQSVSWQRLSLMLFIFVMIFRKRAIRMKMLYHFQSYVFRSGPWIWICRETFTQRLSWSHLESGIDRSVTGDILIDEECAYLFCMQKIADFLCDNLTPDPAYNGFNVRCLREKEKKSHCVRKNRRNGCFCTSGYSGLPGMETSRSSLVGMIEDGRVFVNGKCITSMDIM